MCTGTDNVLVPHVLIQFLVMNKSVEAVFTYSEETQQGCFTTVKKPNRAVSQLLWPKMKVPINK